MTLHAVRFLLRLFPLPAYGGWGRSQESSLLSAHFNNSLSLTTKIPPSPVCRPPSPPRSSVWRWAAWRCGFPPVSGQVADLEGEPFAHTKLLGGRKEERKVGGSRDTRLLSSGVRLLSSSATRDAGQARPPTTIISTSNQSQISCSSKTLAPCQKGQGLSEQCSSERSDCIYIYVCEATYYFKLRPSS